MSESPFNIDLVSFENIIITNAAIENKDDLTSLEPGSFVYDLVMTFQPGINLEDKKVRLIFNCNLDVLNKEEQPLNITARFAIAFIFVVKNLQDLVKLDDQLDIDGDMLTSLGNIAYSTSRGIILTRCQGTILKKIVLPIMSNEKIAELLQPEAT